MPRAKNQAPAWESTHLDCHYNTLFLRVMTTNTPRRWRWLVAELNTVTKEPHWWGSTNGTSASIANGYSSSRERACEDAVAMADAILRKPK